MSKAKTSSVAEAIESVSSQKVRSLHAASDAELEAKGSTTPIRINTSTKVELDRIIEAIAQGAGRKRVKPDAVLRHALSKLRDQDIEELRSRTVSYSELFDREFQRHKAENANVTRDEFLGMVLLGKVKVRTGSTHAK